MRFRLTEWAAAGVIFLVLLLGVVVWGWRYLYMERTALAAFEPEAEIVTPLAGGQPAGGTTGGEQSEAIPAGAVPSVPETPVPTREPELVYVHVAGAVRRPGVYRLHEGARIFEAVDEAGGATEAAWLDRINLAERVNDGQKVYVPHKGEENIQEAAPVPVPVESAPQRINLNRAHVADLQRIPGIGPVLANAIVQHRARHGPFRTVEEITQVPGIKQGLLEKIRPYVMV